MKKHNGKATDLGFGHLGNGITVWDRTREKRNDYLMVAHIDTHRQITYHAIISEEQKSAIEEYANTDDPNISQCHEQKVFMSRPTKK
jgi:hypothetical protein